MNFCTLWGHLKAKSEPCTGWEIQGIAVARNIILCVARVAGGFSLRLPDLLSTQ